MRRNVSRKLLFAIKIHRIYLDFRNFNYWITTYFYFIICKRSCRWIYSWFLVSQHGWNGLLLAFVSVLPQNLIIIPVFLVMTTIAASFSLRMIRHQFIRKITEPLLPLLIRYTCFFLVIGVVLALASSVEAYASPVLMKEVVEAINKK